MAVTPSDQEATSTVSWWKFYHPPKSAFDEIVTSENKLRDHWEFLIRSLEGLGPQELQQRTDSLQHLLRQSGATYNVYGDPQGAERPWPLDPIPVLITSTEWSHIERGLAQRAELLDLILRDLYSNRRLIKNSIIPPEVIYKHPGFLRPCHGTIHPERGLILYAADLVRGPDGTMQILGDRGPNPSGAGYALENRVSLSRAFPSLFRDSHVHRLAMFFRTMRTTLRNLAPESNEMPFIVVLTPGPAHETYFEHAYMANYLGYLLVQNTDLVVLDQCVWFRSLEGLQKVDVILRRVDDDFCDPLELRGDSLLGVPGLLQAIRSRNVSVVNPLGASVLQNPPLMTFLPQIAKYFLGEELLLPSTPSWWCGNPQHREHIIANLDRMVIKPIYPNPQIHYRFGSQLSVKERDRWIAKLRQNPHEYIGQEQVELSTTPLISKGRLEPRRMGIRSFLVSRGDEYVVMPGGLTRVSPGMDDLVVSNQHGGLSKDTWILASEPEKSISLFTRPTYSMQAHQDRSVSRRIAENMFWIGRYLQRSESAVRWSRKVMMLNLEHEVQNADPCIIGLVQAIAYQTASTPDFVSRHLTQQPTTQISFQNNFLAAQHNGSLIYNIKSLTQAARSIQDQLSDDIWHVIDTLNREMELVAAPSQTLESLDRLILAFAAFRGVTKDSMGYGMGRRFWEMGRQMEWALNLINLLQSTIVHTHDISDLTLQVLLDVEDSHVIYRHRYSMEPHPQSVMEMIVQDASNPRSIATQLMVLHEHVSALAKSQKSENSKLEQLIMEGLRQLRLAQLNPIENKSDVETVQSVFRQLLYDLVSMLHQFSDALSDSYLRPLELPRQLEGANDSL